MAEALQGLKQDRDRFVAFAFAAADILMEVDHEWHIQYADGALNGLLGLDAKTMIGQPLENFIQPKDSPLDEDKIKIMSKARAEGLEWFLVNKMKDRIPFAVSAFRLGEENASTYLSLSLRYEGSNPEELLKHDTETGVLKENAFVEQANEKIREAAEKGEQLELTLIDMPDLTAFLDSLDPEQAKKLMSEIGAYLNEHSVDGDTASLVGDDSFTFVHGPEMMDMQAVMEDISQITQKFDPKGEGIEAQAASIEANPGALSKADSANALLYTINKMAEQVKEGGELDIDSLTDGYQDMLEDTVERIASFKDVVAMDKFKLAFQPIVELKNGMVHHYEALTRLDESDTFSNPFEFITFGEQTDLINEFDLAVLHKTLTTLNTAHEKKSYPVVAVNLSGRSLASNMYKDTVLAMLDLNEKVRKQVIFEVTESSKIDDLDNANEFLQVLRKAGNMCCLDDFGVGESSFEYLRRLQVDFVKIDGSYVRESAKSGQGRQMLKAMASLCRNLNIVTIGEMVEDEKIAGLLWDSGVKFGQGYLFGKPQVDEEELAHCSKPSPFFRGVMRARRVMVTKETYSG